MNSYGPAGEQPAKAVLLAGEITGRTCRQSPGVNARLLPNPDLKPETSKNIELGVRTRMQRLSLDVAAFTGEVQCTVFLGKGHAHGQQPANGFGCVLHHKLGGRHIAQPGTSGERVAHMGVETVTFGPDGGNAALRPGGRAAGELALREDKHAAMVGQRVHGEPRLGHHEGDHLLAPVVVVTPDHRHFEHARVQQQHLSVEGEGQSDEGFLAVLSTPELQPGDIFRHDAYEKTKQRIATLRTEHGYFDGQWLNHEVEVTLPDNTADIELRYDSGARYRLGEIQYRFRKSALPCVVLHPLDLERGFLPQIERTVQKLLSAGRQPVLLESIGFGASCIGL